MRILRSIDSIHAKLFGLESAIVGAWLAINQVPLGSYPIAGPIDVVVSPDKVAVGNVFLPILAGIVLGAWMFFMIINDTVVKFASKHPEMTLREFVGEEKK